MIVRQLIDDRPLGRFQVALVLMGFLVIVSDGLDVVVVGFVAPQLRVEWGVTAQALGFVLSAALLAQVLGAAVSGPLADRFGRRTVVLASVFWFGAWTLAGALSPDAVTLMALRFVAGLGLGAALPNTITLVAEYMPRRMQSFLINLATCGFTVGAAVGGFLAAWIIPSFGWRGVLVFGGVLPLAVFAVLLVWLPESVNFLLGRHTQQDRARQLVRRLGVHVPGDAVLRLPTDDEVPAGPVRTLLLPRYRFGTVALWLSYFLVLFAIYLLSSWLPTLIKEGGSYTVSEAAVVAATFQVGGPVGTLVIGWLMDRVGKTTVLAGALLAGAAAMLAITRLEASFAVLCVAAAAIGFCLNGSAVGMNALAAAFYPTTARATGVSWMTGFGRAGATISAFAGASLLTAGWAASSVFGVLAVPVLVCMVAMSAFGLHERRRALPMPGALSLPGLLAGGATKETQP